MLGSISPILFAEQQDNGYPPSFDKMTKLIMLDLSYKVITDVREYNILQRLNLSLSLLIILLISVPWSTECPC